MPLKELALQKKEQASPPELPPIHVDLVARHYDLNIAERAYVDSIATEKSGHCRRDFIPKNAKMVYRCPLDNCPNPRNHKGVPLNPNGLQRKFQSHLEQHHRSLNRSVMVSVYSHGKLRQQFHLRRPTLHPPHPIVHPQTTNMISPAQTTEQPGSSAKQDSQLKCASHNTQQSQQPGPLDDPQAPM